MIKGEVEDVHVGDYVMCAEKRKSSQLQSDGNSVSPVIKKSRRQPNSSPHSIGDQATSHPSLCIPGVDACVNEELVRSVLGEMRFGTIHSVTLVPCGECFQTVYVHLKEWNEADTDAVACRARLLAGEKIKVACDAVQGWFWQLAAVLPPKESPPPAPPPSSTYLPSPPSTSAASLSMGVLSSAAAPLVVQLGSLVNVASIMQGREAASESSLPPAPVTSSSSSSSDLKPVIDTDTDTTTVSVRVECLPPEHLCSTEYLTEMFQSFRGFTGLERNLPRRFCLVHMSSLECAQALLRYMLSPGIVIVKHGSPLVGKLEGISELIERLRSVKSGKALGEAIDALFNCGISSLKPSHKNAIFELLCPYRNKSMKKHVVAKVSALLREVRMAHVRICVTGFERRFAHDVVREMFSSFRGFVHVDYSKNARRCVVDMDSEESAGVLLAHLASPGIRMTKSSPPLTGHWLSSDQSGGGASDNENNDGDDNDVDDSGGKDGCVVHENSDVMVQPFLSSAQSSAVLSTSPDTPAALMVTEEVQCPADKIGLVIGSHGDIVKEIMRRSSCHIEINQNLPEGEPRVVKITGWGASQVEVAKALVDVVLENGPASLSYCDIGLLPSALSTGKVTTEEMQCPYNKVRSVIGAKGVVVQEIMRRSGCFVSVKKDVCERGYVRVLLTGTAQRVQAARTLVDAVISHGPAVIKNMSGPAGLMAGQDSSSEQNCGVKSTWEDTATEPDASRDCLRGAQSSCDEDGAPGGGTSLERHDTGVLHPLEELQCAVASPTGSPLERPVRPAPQDTAGFVAADSHAAVRVPAAGAGEPYSPRTCISSPLSVRSGHCQEDCNLSRTAVLDSASAEKTRVLISGLPSDMTCPRRFLVEMFQSFRGFVQLFYNRSRQRCIVLMSSPEGAQELLRHLESPGIRMTPDSPPLVGTIKSNGPDEQSDPIVEELMDELRQVNNTHDLEKVVKQFLMLRNTVIRPHKDAIYELLLPHVNVIGKEKLLQRVRDLLCRVHHVAASVSVTGFGNNDSNAVIEDMFSSFRGFVRVGYWRGSGRCVVHMDSEESAGVLLAHLASPGIRMTKSSPPLTGSLHVAGKDECVSGSSTSTSRPDLTVRVVAAPPARTGVASSPAASQSGLACVPVKHSAPAHLPPTSSSLPPPSLASSASSFASAVALPSPSPSARPTSDNIAKSSSLNARHHPPEQLHQQSEAGRTWMALALNEFLKFSTVLD